MKIAFAADPLDSFKIVKDSTFAMMTEAASRGHELYAFGHGDLLFEGHEVKAGVSQITLTGKADDWYQQQAPVLRSLSEFDAVVERTDPPFDMEYVYATYMLERAEANGARVFNRQGAIRSHNEKFAITGFTKFIAPTLVTSDMARIRAFHEQHKDIILKPLDGMGGQGIFRVQANGLNLASIVETLGGNGQRALMVQKFLPEIAAGDKRVLLIGGEVVPFSLARIPQAGEVRGNLASGGKGVAQPVTQQELSIAEELAPQLASRGLHLVGLDFIGGFLTEINVTSPTCFVEISEQTGHDVALQWLTNLEKHIH